MSLTLLAATQALLLADALTPGTDANTAEAWLDAECDRVETHTVSPTHHPFALESERHLLCETGDQRLMVSFADDVLLQAELRGDLASALPESEPDIQFGPLRIYASSNLIHDVERDRVLRLTSLNEATLLAFWDNPSWTGQQASTSPFELPAEIRFGASLEEMETALDGRCQMQRTRPIEEVWLLTEPTEQHQIDCFGYEIAGYPRKLEMVFGDGQLEQIWLIVGPAEIERLRARYTVELGAPTQESETYIVFDDWALTLRKDVPEILLGSDRLQAIWRVQGNE